MCGIIGMASVSGMTGYSAKKIWLQKALLVDTIRGDHSTGLCCVPTNDLNIPLIYKKALAGYDFIQLNQTEKLLTNINDYTFVIGHNRKATKGAINDINAHPFQHEHITLVHNGTLVTRQGIKSSKDVTVDSEAICIAIAEEGADKILPQLDGAYALVWYNSIDCTLNLARNDERPLHFAFSSSNKTMFFASEPWMIKNLADKAFGIDKVFSLKVGKHIVMDAFTEDVTKYEVKDFEIYVPPKQNNIGYRWPDYEYKKGGGKNKHERYIENFGYRWKESIVFNCTSFEKYKNSKRKRGTMRGKVNDVGNATKDLIIAYNVPDILLKGTDYNAKYIGQINSVYYDNTLQEVMIQVSDVKQYVSLSLPNPNEPAQQRTDDGDDAVISTVIGPDNRLITEKKFEELIKYGCSHCQGNLFIEDADDIVWTTTNEPICQECIDVYHMGSI